MLAISFLPEAPTPHGVGGDLGTDGCPQGARNCPRAASRRASYGQIVERNDAPEVVVSYPGAPSSQQPGTMKLGCRFDKNLKPPAVSYPMDNADKKRDEVLQRMLKTPPQKHAPRARPSRDAEELTREIDKGADADLDKIARIVGNKVE